MKIIVNGQDKEFKEKTTVSELLKALELDGKVMAAAVNMNIVKQDNWDKHILVDGDKLELLDFVGGG
ncbi:MAG: sulfur carrier protein ThiS [Campylobacterota bacterium]|nr:sulfur carrier protein ThiS [Campylobacterota bacterium]